MSILATTLLTLIGLLHVYIMILEMFLWTTPRGRRAFATTAEFAEASKTLAANQGLYNGFLAAGLFWGTWLGVAGQPIQLFFLGCVAVAGVFGAVTASKKILVIQTIPALITLAVLLLT
jgi:putative membrane protein